MSFSLVENENYLGFIMMTPQLFINYKLKSVSHLPWRMMTYKALNTFIDDLFAFVIKMPTMYRLGCFRDGKSNDLSSFQSNLLPFRYHLFHLPLSTLYLSSWSHTFEWIRYDGRDWFCPSTCGWTNNWGNSSWRSSIDWFNGWWTWKSGIVRTRFTKQQWRKFLKKYLFVVLDSFFLFFLSRSLLLIQIVIFNFHSFSRFVCILTYGSINQLQISDFYHSIDRKIILHCRVLSCCFFLAVSSFRFACIRTQSQSIHHGAYECPCRCA